MSLIIETERDRILSLHNKEKNEGFVFDFVLTENNKYLIFMDNVFVNGGNGNSIGTIWENTHIFNEIIIESLKAKNLLTESISTTLENITWSKKDIQGWVNDKSELVENKFTDFLSGEWNKTWSNLKDGKQAAAAVFKGEILPFLQWIRKMTYTNIGIVLDIVATIFLAKSTAVVWSMIVLLDVYEIATNNIAPDRKDSPYIGMICDLLALVFAGVAAKTFQVASKGIIKNGITNPSMIKTMRGLLNKLPGIKTMLDKAGTFLIKKFPKGGMVQKMLGFVGNVFKGLSSFINGLLKKGGQKVGGTVVKRSSLGVGLNNVDKLADGYSASAKVVRKVFGLNEGVEELDEQAMSKLGLKLGDIGRKVIRRIPRNTTKFSTTKLTAAVRTSFNKSTEEYVLKVLQGKHKNVLKDLKTNPTSMDFIVKDLIKSKKATNQLADISSGYLDATFKGKIGLNGKIIASMDDLTPNQLLSVKNHTEGVINSSIDQALKLAKRESGVFANKLHGDHLARATKIQNIIKGKKANIPQVKFDKLAKESVLGTYVRGKDLYKNRLKNVGNANRGKSSKQITQKTNSSFMGLNPITGTVFSLVKGTVLLPFKIIKVVVTTAKLGALGLLGLGGWGAWKLYSEYNDTSKVDENTALMFEDGEGNPLDPETLQEINYTTTVDGAETEVNGEPISTGSTIPQELQDIIDSGEGKYVTSPQEGIYVVNNDYPNGVYLFNNGTVQDPTTGEEGTWNPDSI